MLSVPRSLCSIAASSSCAAVTVANVYLAQPLLADLAKAFAESPARVGIVVTLAQVGYSADVLLIVPLGDMRDRRQVILILHGAVTAGLLLAACAPSTPREPLAPRRRCHVDDGRRECHGSRFALIECTREPRRCEVGLRRRRHHFHGADRRRFERRV